MNEAVPAGSSGGLSGAGREGNAPSRPAASVIVPAHDEEALIGRLLAGLEEGIRSGALDVVVVCNACTDGTATIARDQGARVVEIDERSKTAALNAGDAAARVYPRIYLDADIIVDAERILDLASPLFDGRALCASLPFTVELDGRPWLVRAYFSVWQEVPLLNDRYVGAGLYALSEGGRARFDAFPHVFADDLYIRNLFTRDERCVVEGKPFTIEAPWTARSLLRRRVRILAGNLDLQSRTEYRSHPGALERSDSLWKALLGQPRLIPAACVYSGVNLLAQLLARWQRFRNPRIDWVRDETTRQ